MNPLDKKDWLIREFWAKREALGNPVPKSFNKIREELGFGPIEEEEEMYSFPKYKIEDMSGSELHRLELLIQYHHSLSIQSSSRGCGAKILKCEREIEKLLDLTEEK